LKTILITGATGLIGSKLSKECIEDGMTVHYLTTNKNKIETKENYKGFYWSPYEGEIDEKAFDGVSAIINLVGATIANRWTERYKKVILDSRVKTANLILETLKNIDHSVNHFISSSGVSVYPHSETKLYTEESTEVDNSFLAQVVVAWEAAADQFISLGIDVVKVRTGVVFSGEDGALPKLVKPVKMGMGAPLGNGKQWLSWIHIDDIVGVYMHIMKHKLEGVYNAVAPTPINNRKITKLIAHKLDMPMLLPNVPAFMLKLLLGEMAVLVLEGQIVSPKKIEEQGYKFAFFNVESALKDLL
jgi:uncharacterized protein (TIGR01777 family)